MRRPSIPIKCGTRKRCRMKNIVTSVFIIISMTGCYEQTHVDQSNICVFNSDEGAKQCKDGELAYFSPDKWGNEQRPLNVAAAYCDFNYEVMYNDSGFICVFTKDRLSLLE